MGFHRLILTNPSVLLLYNIPLQETVRKGIEERVKNLKKQTMDPKEEFGSILPEYGKRKLITYADTIRELAESFQ